jgi:flavin reductase (DIM6/NTAB) family NADH-FMN oxidoreductase RutF
MKKSIEKKTALFTHPVLIIGSYDEKKTPNIATVSWGGICCSEPPSVAISLRKQRHTYQNIMLNKSFTVNIPSDKYVRESDYAGIISGKNENKFETTGLTPVDSGIVNAPYIEEFPLSLLCKVINMIELGSHTQFIGEIMDILADEDIMNEDGLPDIKKSAPFIYDTLSRSYYKTGDRMISAYTIKKI